MKIIYAAAFTILSLTSLASAKPSSTEFIKHAIAKGNLDVINACIETDLAVSFRDKQEYITLARTALEKKKLDAKKTAAYVSIESISLAVSIATVGLLAWDAYDTYQNKDGKMWKSQALFGLSLCKLADSAVKLSKDLTKEEEKGRNDIATAEAVAAAVDKL